MEDDPTVRCVLEGCVVCMRCALDQSHWNCFDGLGLKSYGVQTDLLFKSNMSYYSIVSIEVI